ncbi:MAG: DUF2341 domain-containing protein, partial [Lentisphaerae bacterium]|nr:DUF2341 domain-containing protein [Lentisphaerota bacterium]
MFSRSKYFASVLMLILGAISLYAEDLTHYQKCMTISFPGYTNTETLFNFPILIVFEQTDEGSGFYYSDFLSPPDKDLRFTADDKTTQLDYEVESWDTDGKSYVWVKIPELNQNTKILAFWGMPNVEAPDSTEDGSVWSEDYLGVWHMNDKTSTTIADRSTNSYHGTKKEEDSPTEVD